MLAKEECEQRFVKDNNNKLTEHCILCLKCMYYIRHERNLWGIIVLQNGTRVFA